MQAELTEQPPSQPPEMTKAQDQRPLQASFDPPASQIRIIKAIGHQIVLAISDAQLGKNLIPGILIEVTQHSPMPWNDSILTGF